MGCDMNQMKIQLFSAALDATDYPLMVLNIRHE